MCNPACKTTTTYYCHYFYVFKDHMSHWSLITDHCSQIAKVLNEKLNPRGIVVEQALLRKVVLPVSGVGFCSGFCSGFYHIAAGALATIEPLSFP